MCAKCIILAEVDFLKASSMNMNESIYSYILLGDNQLVRLISRMTDVVSLSDCQTESLCVILHLREFAQGLHYW